MNLQSVKGSAKAVSSLSARQLKAWRLESTINLFTHMSGIWRQLEPQFPSR